MDIDCLGSEAHLQYLLEKGENIRGVGEVRERWWNDGRSDRYAHAVDVVPRSRKMLPVTVCNEMIGTFPIDWSEARAGSVVECFGIDCMDITRVLVWKAMTGRRKDLVKVGRVLPVATGAGLVSPNDSDCVSLWLKIGWQRGAYNSAAAGRAV
jgi:hypothetical protein